MAKRITFTKNFDYKPDPNLILAYKAGDTLDVLEACATAAIEAGCAVLSSDQKGVKPAAPDPKNTAPKG